jgi:rhodanese-related sulfurtransferase
MRKFLMLALSAGCASGLLAYGVSPSQYNNGRAQDSQSAPQQGLPNAPQPMPFPGGQIQPQPVPGGAIAPGGQTINLNAQPTPQDYDAIAVPDWAKGWKHYHWEEAKSLWEGKGALFCDARSNSEYVQGHIPGAISLPAAEFDKYFEKYKGKIKAAGQLVTYCHGVGCQLSNKVAQKLVNDKKFKNVGSFFGGWPQWQQHNMPVETGAEPKPR